MSSLGGILNNGVNGMLAFTQAMGSVSDNVANMSTVGYKRADTAFSSMLGEPYIPGRGNGPTANTNLNGVMASTRQLVSVQGNIQTTNHSLDLAINGSGMFIFTDDPLNPENIFYGRAGNFQTLVPNGGNIGYLANERGQYLLAAPAGTTSVSSTSDLVPVQVSQTGFAGTPTTTATMTAVIPAAGASTVTAPLSYIDSNGSKQTLTATWTKGAVVSGTSTTWQIDVTDNSSNNVGTGTMVFDNVGAVTSGSTLAITATGGSFTLDMSNVNMLGSPASISGNTALAQVIDYQDDGLPSGNFQNLSIGKDGTIINLYSNGATSAVYQIPLALFTAPDSLEAKQGDVFAETTESGAPQFIFPGTGLATLAPGAVEESNVDIADSFSQMIITQRAYQSAAQVVKVADEMTSTAANLKR